MDEEQHHTLVADDNLNEHARAYVKLNYHAPLMKLHPMRDVIQGGIGDMTETEGAMGS
jgi:hypothetical protein